MKALPCLLAFGSLLAGCHSVQFKPKHGEEWTVDEKGYPKLITYVTAEEYERMTEDERKWTNATVPGLSATMSWGKSDKSSATPAKPLTASELDRVLSAPRKNQGPP